MLHETTILLLDAEALAAALTAILGAAVFLGAIRHPTVDSASLLAFSHALTAPTVMDRNFLMVMPGDREVYRFEKNVTFCSYNLWLNLLRLFPAGRRFRMAQYANMALLGLLVTLLTLALRQLMLRAGVVEPLWPASGFAMLLAARTKLLATAAFIYSEVLNFCLFALSILLAMHLETPTVPAALGFGFVLGLGFRNRQTDLPLFLAGCGYLLLSWRPGALGLCILGFLLATADLLYLQFVRRLPALDGLTCLFKCNLPHAASDTPRRSLVRVALKGLWIMFRPFGPRSIWVSAGLIPLMFPLSLAVVILTGNLPGAPVYLLLCWLGTTASLLLVRETPDEDGLAFFSHRPAYLLMIVMHLFNGFAFALLLVEGAHALCLAYLAVYGVHLAMQAKILLGHLRSDEIVEPGLHQHPKEPPAYAVELRRVLLGLKGPVVAMGSQLSWGETYDFFQWNEGLRAVNLGLKTDDAMLAKLIHRYQVTHLVLTPHSWYPIPGQCSVRKNELGPGLAELLTRTDHGSGVTLFATPYAASGAQT